jgi:hypothetical protein
MDTDDNERDFQLQKVVNIVASAVAGTKNIKVSAVQDFTVGQPVYIGSGDNWESAVIGTLGTPGSTTLTAPAEKGTSIVYVSSAQGFNIGQRIVIGHSDQQEKSVIISIATARRRYGGRNANIPVPPDTLKVAVPLKRSYEAGVSLSGTGITLTAPLKKEHFSGEQLASDLPTPGMPNRYYRKP